eukprot:jgi/Ulvmu1/12765/UM096_0006.1
MASLQTANSGCRRHRGARCVLSGRAGHSARRVAADAAATTTRKQPFPFTRIAGQEEMKQALILNVIDPSIGGVLIMGDRGTGKSVAVRSLVEVLPFIDVIEGDPFNSSPTDPKIMGPDALQRFRAGEELPATRLRTPLVELPLGATEDRICGTIDIERALRDGVKAFEPGLLARANRGILYVDEVNLLEDNLVDVVLDSAAGGVNTVEREGVSIIHPAKFIMIGSGNPAEGEMRPQLLDRFGLAVNVGTLIETETRLAMVLDRMRYDADPDALLVDAGPEMEDLTDKITKAKDLLPRVKISRDIKLKIATVCSMLNIDGLRGDLVVNRASQALVAFEGRTEVTEKDVPRVLGVCLNHRLRKDVMDEIDGGLKVQLAWRRVTDPKAAEKARVQEEAAAKKAAEGAAAGEAGEKKAGSWGGLPF